VIHVDAWLALDAGNFAAGIEQARAEFDVVPYHCGGIPRAYFAHKFCAGAPPLGGETAVEYVGPMAGAGESPSACASVGKVHVHVPAYDGELRIASGGVDYA
jgi:hypothetical protein